MKTPIIKEYDQKVDLAELYQKSGLRYAFISAPKDGSAMCHPFVKCRDFLHDAVRAMITGSSCEIYGFKFDSKTDPPIDLRRIRMRLKYDTISAKKFAELMESSLKLIHFYENAMGIKTRTNYVCCADGMYVVSGPSIWTKSPVLITLYTLLFRIAEHKPDWSLAEKNSLDKMYEELISRFKDKLMAKEFKDLKYLSQTHKFLQVIVEDIHTLCDMHANKYDPAAYDKELTTHNYHNFGGVVSLCTGSYMLPSRQKVLEKLVKESKENKDLFRVKGFSNLSPYTTYQPHKLGFALVSMDGDIRVQRSQFTNCREQVISAFRKGHKDSINNVGVNGVPKQALPFLDDKKLRLLVRVPGVLRNRARMAAHKKELFFAKRVLNYYEKYLGIKKSVISTVIIEYKSGTEYGWLLTASDDWLASPVMLSLYLTILRSAKSYMYNSVKSPELFPIAENINNKEVKKMWSLLKEHQLFIKFSDDDIHVKSAIVHKVLRNRKTLFGVGTVQRNFFIGKKNMLKNAAPMEYSVRVGIHSLLNHTHIDKELIKKFKELKK